MQCFNEWVEYNRKRAWIIILFGFVSYFLVAYVIAPLLVKYNVSLPTWLVIAIPIVVVGLILAFNRKLILPLVSGFITLYLTAFLVAIITPGDDSETMGAGPFFIGAIVAVIVMFVVNQIQKRFSNNDLPRQ